MRFSFLNLGLLAGGLLMASSAEAATPVNCGDVLSAPGQYYLAGDLACDMSAGGPAVSIQASDVHFNLRGHRITELAGNNAGIQVGCFDESTALSGVRITNGIIDGFDFGIFACRTADLQLEHVELINSITALNLRNVVDGNITASVFAGSDFAIAVRESDGNRFHGNRLSGLADACNRGYFTRQSNNNIVTGNEIVLGCGGDSGVLLSGSGNIVRGNRISGNGGSFGVLAQSAGNIIQANRVSGFVTDLKDDSDLLGSCENNTWKANQFGTAIPSCLK